MTMTTTETTTMTTMTTTIIECDIMTKTNEPTIIEYDNSILSSDDKIDCRITIPKTVSNKIKYLCQIADNREWLGFLITETDNKTNTITLKDIILPPQVVTTTECELDTEKFLDIMVKMGEETPEVLSNMLGVIHSHNNMGVFWSGTDDHELHDTLIKYMPTNKAIVSVVVNNKLDTKSMVLIKGESLIQKFDNIDTVLEDFNNNEFEELKKLFETNVIEKKIPVYSYSSYYPNRNNFLAKELYKRNGTSKFSERLTTDYFPKVSEKLKVLTSEEFYDIYNRALGIKNKSELLAETHIINKMPNTTKRTKRAMKTMINYIFYGNIDYQGAVESFLKKEDEDLIFDYVDDEEESFFRDYIDEQDTLDKTYSDSLTKEELQELYWSGNYGY